MVFRLKGFEAVHKNMIVIKSNTCVFFSCSEKDQVTTRHLKARMD